MDEQSTQTRCEVHQLTVGGGTVRAFEGIHDWRLIEEGSLLSDEIHRRWYCTRCRTVEDTFDVR